MNGACCILACPAQQTRLVAARLKSLNSAVAARTPPGLKHFRRAKTWAYLTVLYKYLHSLAPFRYKRGKTIPTAYKGSSTSGPVSRRMGQGDGAHRNRRATL